MSKKEGWMTKDGHSLLSSWKRRWFVLRNGNLGYYETPDATDSPSGMLGFISVTHPDCHVKAEPNGPRGRLRFSVTDPEKGKCPPIQKRYLLVEVEDEATRRDWIEHLQLAKEAFALGAGGAASGPASGRP
jgi:hypothetical protein